MKKSILIAIFLVLVFLISICLGFKLSGMINSNNIKIEQESVLATKEGENDAESITTSSIDEIVTPNTLLVLNKYYKKCNHTITDEMIVPEEIVNYDFEKVQNYYSDWQIKDFSDEKIVLYKEVDQICNEHYLINEHDGFIAINSIGPDGKVELKEITDFAVQYLPEEDAIKIKNGIEVYGLENLNSILEDFE